MKTQMFSIAMFPLNIIVFPGEEVPLRIFEPRYKQLISECEETGMSFGIPYIDSNGLTSLGSHVTLHKLVTKVENGNSVIIIKGINLFKLHNFSEELPGKLYGGGIVEHFENDYPTQNSQLAVLVKKLRLNLSNTLGTLIINNSISMLDVARALMLNSEQKYKFLTLKDDITRENFLINRLKLKEFILTQEQRIENNFHLN